MSHEKKEKILSEENSTNWCHVSKMYLLRQTDQKKKKLELNKPVEDQAQTETMDSLPFDPLGTVDHGSPWGLPQAHGCIVTVGGMAFDL